MLYRTLIKVFTLLALQVSDCEAAQNLIFVFSEGNAPLTYNEGSREAKGLGPDLVRELLKYTAGIDAKLESVPWKRAQHDVRTGKAHLFCTYPSNERKNYALFTKSALYELNYGFLIYNKHSTKADSIGKIRTLQDLENFTFVSQAGVSWEDENIPKTVKRIYVNKLEYLMHMVLGRNEGDFFVMTPEQTNYYAKRLKYEDKLAILPAHFLPNRIVPFHIGIHKNVPGAEKILAEFEQAIHSPDFLKSRDRIMKSYQFSQLTKEGR